MEHDPYRDRIAARVGHYSSVVGMAVHVHDRPGRLIAQLGITGTGLTREGQEAFAARLARDINRGQIIGQARHLNTGGLYDVLGPARLQTAHPLTDMADLVLYRGQQRPDLWARERAEFYDGRFEIIR